MTIMLSQERDNLSSRMLQPPRSILSPTPASHPDRKPGTIQPGWSGGIYAGLLARVASLRCPREPSLGIRPAPSGRQIPRASPDVSGPAPTRHGSLEMTLWGRYSDVSPGGVHPEQVNTVLSFLLVIILHDS